MKTVVGMAKSFLDLGGCRHAKTELDLFKIAHALQFLKSRGKGGVGYILVMTPSIQRTALEWIQKYKFAGEFKVVVAPITDAELSILRSEKERNKEGMVKGSMGEAPYEDSDAPEGRRLGESYLINSISQEHPGIRSLRKKEFPLGINWDYCGITVR